jgi:hypothetical protein
MYTPQMRQLNKKKRNVNVIKRETLFAKFQNLKKNFFVKLKNPMT